MRFDIKPKPNLGDKKHKKKFAFFPIKINDTKRIWFESYYQHYIYKNIYNIIDYGYSNEWAENYRETIDFKYNSKIIEYQTFDYFDDIDDIIDEKIEKRNKTLDDILNRI